MTESFRQVQTCVDGSWTEGLPDNSLTDIGSNEERNTRPQTVAFLQQLIEQQNHESSTQQLQEQEIRHCSEQVAL